MEFEPHKKPLFIFLIQSKNQSEYSLFKFTFLPSYLRKYLFIYKKNTRIYMLLRCTW